MTCLSDLQHRIKVRLKARSASFITFCKAKFVCNLFRFAGSFSVPPPVIGGKFSCMSRITKRPVALTIAGSDSGGGAGIQADLKTFAAFGVHGASAITCLTAQNPKRIHGVELCSPKMLQRQIEAVFEELHPAAVKTGMLFSAEIVRVITGFFKKRKRPPLVVDPVMVSTSGTMLLKPAAIEILMKQLLPIATLVTPNLHEAEILTGCGIVSLKDLRTAAKKFHERFGCAVLVKGGHLPQPRNSRSARKAIDVFFDGRTELLLGAPFVEGVSPHGAGCTYSAAVTAALAMSHSLPHAVKLAKRHVTHAIARSYRIGKHFALGHIS